MSVRPSLTETLAARRPGRPQSSAVRPTARPTVLALLLALSQGAQASIGTPQLVVSDAPTVAEDAADAKLRFFVDAAIFPVPRPCQPSQPDCNARTFRVCVDYHTVSGTATAGVDFVPRSGRLDTVLFTDGVSSEVLPVGSVDVSVLSDTLVEGAETVKLQLTQPPASECQVQYNITRPVGQGVISDGVSGAPDLTLVNTSVSLGCNVSLMVKNIGGGTVPDAAYTSPTSASLVAVNVNGGVSTARLADIDPQRLLKTPGGTVFVNSWFDVVGNPPNLEGTVNVQATVDVNGVIAESLETNNSLRRTGSC